MLRGGISYLVWILLFDNGGFFYFCLRDKYLKMRFNPKPILFFALALASAACMHHAEKNSSSDQNKDLVFTTWDNICYDRAASVWLIHRFVDSSAQFQFVEFGKKIHRGIPFDVPGAELGRQKNLSCFETVINKYSLKDSTILEMANIVHDIDVNIWGPKKIALSDSLDRSFKKMREQTDDEHQLLDETRFHFEQLYKYLKNN